MSEIKSGEQWDITTHISGWPKSRTDNTKCWRGYGATGTLVRCRWECRASLWKTVWQFSYKTEHSLTRQSSNPHNAPWYLCPHKNLHKGVTAALFINAKNLETTILSWVNGYINLGTSDNGILFSAEKNEHSNHEKTCEVKVKVAQSCPTLCSPVDYTVHGILQARILEWVTIPFSRGSFQPRDRTLVSCIAGGFFSSWATREAQRNLKCVLLSERRQSEEGYTLHDSN